MDANASLAMKNYAMGLCLLLLGCNAAPAEVDQAPSRYAVLDFSVSGRDIDAASLRERLVRIAERKSIRGAGSSMRPVEIKSVEFSIAIVGPCEGAVKEVRELVSGAVRQDNDGRDVMSAFDATVKCEEFLLQPASTEGGR